MKNTKGKIKNFRRKLAAAVAILDFFLCLLWMSTLVTYRGTNISTDTKLWGQREWDAAILYFLHLITCAFKITMGIFLSGAIYQQSYGMCMKWIKCSIVLMVPIVVLLVNDTIFRNRDACMHNAAMDALVLVGQITTSIGVIHYACKLKLASSFLPPVIGPIPTISIQINEKEKVPPK